MLKSLIDSSTYFDMLNAPRHQHANWAKNTSRHTMQYLAAHPKLTLSALTIVEVVDGLKRKGQDAAIAQFLSVTLAQFDVRYPDQSILALGGEINAVLSLTGNGIGVIDCLIAGSAIVHNLTLVTANIKHFSRVQVAGFPLRVENWREA